MTDFNSKEYKDYYADQKADTIGAGLGSVYLPKLIELLPNFNFGYASILDLGAGPFDTFDWFLKNYNVKIWGADIGDCVLEYAKEKQWSEDKLGFLEFPLDAHKLTEEFAPEAFDIVISFHALEHMYDLPQVLSEINKVLVPGGYLYQAVPIPSYNWKKGHWYDIPTESYMDDLIRKAGFEVIYSELISDLRYRPQQEMISLNRKL